VRALEAVVAAIAQRHLSTLETHCLVVSAVIQPLHRKGFETFDDFFRREKESQFFFSQNA
jgi:hypothetical protein